MAAGGHASERLILVEAHLLLLRHRRQHLLLLQHLEESRRITRAFRRRRRSSIAPAPSGHVQQTDRSSETAPPQVGLVLKFFTAIASSMCSVQIRSGGGGMADG